LTRKAPYKPALAKAGGRCMDNIFVERLWRSLKYEEVYLNAYTSVAEAKAGIGERSAVNNRSEIIPSTPGFVPGIHASRPAPNS
jgi:transposase InsO family protein